MILIDASNISIGGGKVLLEYLIHHLRLNHYSFIIIRNQKHIYTDVNNTPTEIFVDCPGPRQRKETIRSAIKKYTPGSLLCFGNYPPPEKSDVKTITYFHNPHLIRPPFKYIFSDPLLSLRQYYLRKYLMNTDAIIFQSGLIKKSFKKAYSASIHLELQIIPFYNVEKITTYISEKPKANQFVYTSLPYKHKNHAGLLSAWKILAERKLFPVLVLTIPMTDMNKQLIATIDEINTSGGNIKNLGEVNYDQALRSTAESRYAIFPSLDETFGLGLVEAAILGSNVIAADLPYVYESIKPSLVFDPLDAKKIADVLEWLLTSSPEIPTTQLVVKSKINELVELLI